MPGDCVKQPSYQLSMAPAQEPRAGCLGSRQSRARTAKNDIRERANAGLISGRLDAHPVAARSSLPQHFVASRCRGWVRRAMPVSGARGRFSRHGARQRRQIPLKTTRAIAPSFHFYYLDSSVNLDSYDLDSWREQFWVGLFFPLLTILIRGICKCFPTRFLSRKVRRGLLWK